VRAVEYLGIKLNVAWSRSFYRDINSHCHMFCK